MKIRPRVMRSAMLLIVLCISLLALSPAKAAEAGEEKLRQTAVFILDQCIRTEDEVYELLREQREADLDYMLLQNGVPCGGKNYLAILKAWRDGEEECGAYVADQGIAELIDSFTVKKRNNKLQLTGEVQFANRSADLTFTFENDGTITALTVGGHYDMGEIMKKAMQNTAIGMGVVFAVLIFMSAIISCLRFVGMLQGKKGGEEEGGGPEAKSGADMPEEADDETLCIIAAAIARDLRDYPLRKEEDNMRKYNITVNGKTYGVEVEEADATLVGSRPIRPASVAAAAPAASVSSAAASAASAPAPAASAPSQAPAQAEAPAASGGSGEIKAGITGKVLAVNVSAGQAVKNGDTVMVLEAMKMEIPIVCPKDGTIAKLLVKEGDPVEAGQALATLS